MAEQVTERTQSEMNTKLNNAAIALQDGAPDTIVECAICRIPVTA